jgi:hypothetical protein
VAAAQKVARSMTGQVILGYDPTQVLDDAQVTVVTGTQFAVNPPSANSTPTTAVTGTTAGSTGGAAASTTSGASAGFTPPSTTTQKLQPWDPGACRPGATPTAPMANPLPG